MIHKLKITLFFLLVSFGVKCQDTFSDFGFQFRGKFQKSEKLKFELHANLMVLRLKIDNSDTLNFILDTGVSTFIITDPSLAAKLKLKYVRKVKIKGAGEGEFVNANVSIGHKVDLGFVRHKNANLVILEEDILKLSEYMGIPIHGIFGHELFARFVVNVNFANKSLRLSEPKKYKERKKDGEKYPLIVTNSKPYIESTSIAQNDNSYTPLRLVIDTGAGHALMLNTQESPPIHLPEKVIRANLGRGLNGDIDGHIGRVPKFKIGKYEFKDVLASFPDSLSFATKFDLSGESTKRQGSIGGEFLRRFTITFNYNKGYIALRPLKAKYRETFEHDMSGMEVRAQGKDLDEFFVTFVTPGSQAEKAKIKVGDQIIFMNNKHYKDLNINEIYNYLSRKEGRDIELFLRRSQSELFFAYFKLKRVI